MKMDFLNFTDKATGKQEFFLKLLSRLDNMDQEQKRKTLQALIEREKLGDTCIAPGIALAHAQLDEIAAPVLQIVYLSHPVKWEKDMPSVKIVILLLIPEQIDKENQQIIRRLMRFLADEKFCKKMIQATDELELEKLLTLNS